MPLTLVQKRALLAAANNLNKAEKEFKKVNNAYWSLPAWWRLLTLDERENTHAAAHTKMKNARASLVRLEHKLGVNGTTINYHLMSKNVISNVLKKNPRVQEKIWLKGLEAEKKRALANFNNFMKGRMSPTTNHIGASHRKKTPSPPRRRTPNRAPPPLANNAHRRVHGIGPTNNTHITWSRNANGKINRFNTLEKINMKLSQAERNALRNMSENQAVNYIRTLARER
jgi:hypothetical protein